MKRLACFGFVLAIVCVGVLVYADSPQRAAVDKVAGSGSDEFPLKQTYEGPGSAVILDTGEVIVFVGEDAQAKKDAYNTIIMTPRDVRGLALLEDEGAVSIGIVAEAGRGATVTEFVALDVVDPQELLTLTGRLKVTVEMQTIAVELITDDDHTFNHLWHLMERKSPLFPRPLAAVSASSDGGGGEAGRAGPKEESSTCSTTCPRGSASITCDGKGCYAYCATSGLPFAGCGERADAD